MNTCDCKSPRRSQASKGRPIAGRSGIACSAGLEGRQAQRGGDGLVAGPLEGKRSAQAPAMEAEGARRYGRLDAQHDSAARHRRGMHGNP